MGPQYLGKYVEIFPVINRPINKSFVKAFIPKLTDRLSKNKIFGKL